MTPQPDQGGHFGPYGGRYVPEVLMAPIEELETAYLAAREDPAFQAELAGLLHNYAGRPTPLYFAKRLSETLGGARIWLKREDLLHTGAHKINNCLGQALLARRMGKRRIIAETGAGQHGVATATVCALLRLRVRGLHGRRRHAAAAPQRLPHAHAGRQGGSRSATGSRTLKDAISEAMRDWVTNVADTYYLLGSALGSHPYPMMVRDFQKVIGEEARRQILEAEGRLAGHHFRLRGRRQQRHRHLPRVCARCRCGAGGHRSGRTRRLRPGEHAARFRGGAPGVLQGAYSYVLQDENGQIALTHSVSAGLDYAMIGPEHAWLHDRHRAEYVAASDGEALAAALLLSRTEGIIPALESAHAIAEAVKRAPAAKGKIFLVNVSGRGDKDIDIYRENLKELDEQ